MEPGSPSSIPSPEMAAYHPPEAPKTGEDLLKHAPEKAPVVGETAEVNNQTGNGQVPAMALPQLPKLPVPQPVAAVTPVPADNTGPLVAADEDLVEKEWVDKAKRIVAQTKSDPHSQEKEVSKLQADYLKKRYGKELKLSSE